MPKDPDSISNLHAAQAVVKASGIMQKMPFYYEGAGVDIVNPLAYSDATIFVFNDQRYIGKNGNIDSAHLPDKVLAYIGATNIIVCNSLQTHPVTISSSSTPSTNASSSSTTTTVSTSTSAPLPAAGIFQDTILYVMAGGILLAAGIFLRVLLKII